MLRTLRQPRYAALSALMLLVAAICVALGTWQIARLAGKISQNSELRANAHAPAVPAGDLLPLTTHGVPSAHRIQFRTVTATGSYDAARQALVRQRSVGDATGYLVLTPLRTDGGVLLVVRGFLADSASGATPRMPAPVAGTVQVRARVEPGESADDGAGQLSGHQLESINPRQQAVLLGAPVYAGYAALLSGQPGGAQLTAIPAPDLSNPAGGAVEPQHLAYIIQWYLFAALALAAPFAMARAETREQRTGEFDEIAAEPALDPTRARAARLADRYGRSVRP
ncbi:MAG: SURF1 family protein [Jatrophihabitantaceae bacterium]